MRVDKFAQTIKSTKKNCIVIMRKTFLERDKKLFYKIFQL